MSIVYLLGTGTCRISKDSGQNSACVIMGDGYTTFLIDCGTQAIERLVKVGGLETCKTLHIHISHRHTDHLFGLFQLLQCLTWSDDRRHLQVEKVYIHATCEVCDLIDEIRSISDKAETDLLGNYPDEGRKLVFCPGPDFEDWTYHVGELEVLSKHLPGVNNHGVKFTLDGKVYAFTADALVVDENLFDFCRNVDVLVFDFGHIVNVRQKDGTWKIDRQNAVELLVRSNVRVAHATHIYLRNLQHQIVTSSQRELETALQLKMTDEGAKARGFKGQIRLGEDLLKIS